MLLRPIARFVCPVGAVIPEDLCRAVFVQNDHFLSVVRQHICSVNPRRLRLKDPLELAGGRVNDRARSIAMPSLGLGSQRRRIAGSWTD